MQFKLTPLVLANMAAAMVLPSLNGFDVQSVFGQVAITEKFDSKKETAQLTRESPAPLIKTANLLPNKYIVVFNEDVSPAEFASQKAWINSLVNAEMNIQSELEAPSFFELPSFAGLLGTFTPEVLSKIQNNPHVKFIEEDGLVKLLGTEVQENAPWGISRLSSRKGDATLDSYIHNPLGGEGVTAYVVDTGVKIADEDFEGRAVYGEAVAFPHLKVDLHGHGSHVAGTIGSKTWGVAKLVDIVAVGVMSPLGTGLTSDIIKGLEFVVADHQRKIQEKKKGFKGSTVNMSIGGGASDALDAAANAVVNSGIHVVVAAGNEDADACEGSPGRASGPITVGAVDRSDSKASFSNYGNCVDIHAPGVDIESVGLFSSPAVMSGTSMASPHVAGLASYLLSLQPGLGSEFNSKLIKPSDFKKKLLKYGTQNVLKGLSADTVNILAYNGGYKPTEIWE